MKIISIDLETTGLDPFNNQIIEVGLVLFDTITNERKTASWLIQHEHYTGDAFALAMNKDIFDELKEASKSKEFIVSYKYLSEYIDLFLKTNNVSLPITVCGKNFSSFDLQFLKQIEGFDQNWFHRRVLDIGSLYFNPLIDDSLPSLTECKKRAGLPSKVLHRALDDANDIIDLIIEYYDL